MSAQQPEYQGESQKRSTLQIAILVAWVVVLVAVSALLTHYGANVAEWVIAMFTACMTFISFLQWEIMREQNVQIFQQTVQMIAQNEAIEKELEQMRLEQRSWLVVDADRIDDLVTDLPHLAVKWQVAVENTGPTPATITHSQLELFHLPNDTEVERKARQVEAEAREGAARKTIVAPGRKRNFNLWDEHAQVILSQAQCRAIRNSQMEVYLIGVFIYKDVFERPHKSVCCFKYDVMSGQLADQFQYGFMD